MFGWRLVEVSRMLLDGIHAVYHLRRVAIIFLGLPVRWSSLSNRAVTFAAPSMSRSAAAMSTWSSCLPVLFGNPSRTLRQYAPRCSSLQCSGCGSTDFFVGDPAPISVLRGLRLRSGTATATLPRHVGRSSDSQLSKVYVLSFRAEGFSTLSLCRPVSFPTRPPHWLGHMCSCRTQI